MNEWLAKVYNTGGASQEDLEKIAQAEMAQQMAQNEGLSLGHLNEEQIAALGNEVLGGGAAGGQPGAQGAQPQGQGGQPGEGGGIDPSQIDPAQLTPEVMQQVEQVLANPALFRPEIVQEAQAIQQVVQAQQGQQPQQPMAKTAAERMKEAQEKFEEADFLGRVMAHSFNQEVEKIAASKRANAQPQTPVQQLGALARGAAPAQAAQPQVAAPQPAAPAPVGGEMGKYASAINNAAEKLAAEILTANGINPQTLQPMQPAQPAATPAPAPAGNAAAVQELVEKRAHQILAQLGFKVE